MTSAGNDTASARQDELFAHLYQQVAAAQAARYAATYDAGAGLVRLKDLLQKHAPADADLASDSDVAAAVAAGADACPVRFRPMPAELGRDADPAVTELYALHYRALVRLATLLLREVPAAEQVVQDSFLAMRDGWKRLRNPEIALAYLRQAVPVGVASPDGHRQKPATGAAGRAGWRPRSPGLGRAVGRGGRASRPARPAARGDRAAVLRGSVRG
jgi:hypothetical protein